VFFSVVVPMTVLPFAGSVTPVPNNIMLAASVANFGFPRSSRHMSGMLVGASVLLYAIGLSTGALFVSLPALQLAIKITGALFLIYLVWRIATATHGAHDISPGRRLSFIAAF
jgi:threonine/homoserine/homoserine lactone efflux protein